MNEQQTNELSMALSLLAIVISLVAMMLTLSEPDYDYHGVPCTISEECR